MRPYIAIMTIITLFGVQSCQETPQDYQSIDEYPTDFEANLWVEYHTDYTIFKIWTPPAKNVRLNIFDNGTDGEPIEVEEMKLGKSGIWKKKINGDLNGKYYTYQIMIDDKWLDETPGIYAQATGVNGKRAMVVDLESTNPEGWEQDKGPMVDRPNEAIIYEAHVRDLSIHPNSGSSFSGKYLGLSEKETKGPNGVSTGIDHLKELGITHIHLLPVFDHQFLDESKHDQPQFNWGYDPQNYNVPEGIYSSNPTEGAIRIQEFKQMVKGFHDEGIGVIMDVVYNHTAIVDGSNFNLEVPAYYYRKNEANEWSNGSGCGNETASEREMMKKFIIESVKYWAKEYHIDGFRFDLMGLHDMETMNEVAAELEKINPSIFVYGEGWTGGSSPLPDEQKALKKNTTLMKNISAFSDDIRDGIKGSVFEDESTGFVSGAPNMEETIKFGVIGGIYHPEIRFNKVNYSDTPWTNQPWQAVSYVSCHDNHTLFDKLKISVPNADLDELKAMDKLANAIVLTTQGISFIHAGSELLRTKGGEHNSYNKPDSVNQINWEWKVDHKDVFEYYRDIIQLKKKHPAFNMPDADMIREKLHFLHSSPGLVGFVIKENANGDPWKNIMVYYNANKTSKRVDASGLWNIAVLGNQVNEDGIKSVTNFIEIPPLSMMIAYSN